MPNIGQNKLWWEVHSYKRLISIFEEVASELLFGLGVKCLEIESSGFPIRTLTHQKYFLIMIDIQRAIVKQILSTI